MSSYFLLSFSNKILVSIDEVAITDMDVKNISKKFNLSKDNSIQKLIADILYNNEFANRNIIATNEEVNQYMQDIASNNNLSLLELQTKISQDMNLDTFRKDIRQRIQKERLTIAILQEKKFSLDEDTLTKYYQANKEDYANWTRIEVKEYISKNKNDLYAIKKNPLIINSTTQIRQNNINIRDVRDIKIRNALISTDKNRFSDIIKKNGFHIMFYIKTKKKNGYNDFQTVKNDIYMSLYTKNKDKIINSYFTKKKTQAEISYK